MDTLLTDFCTGMRYQLASLRPGSDTIPSDMHESKTPEIRRKQRQEAVLRPSRIAETVTQRGKPPAMLNIPRTATSDLASSSALSSSASAGSSPVLDPKRLSNLFDQGKKKRRAPRPPPDADGSPAGKPRSLPYSFDSAGEKVGSLSNPFLDSGAEASESLTNPFLDSTNPFLEDE